MINGGTCGIINLNTGNPIDILNVDALISNSGTIAASFSGPHNNNGTFTNDGIIQTLDGTFNVTTNPLVGSGTIVSGAVPAALTSSCPGFEAEDIPAFNRWSLLFFALLIMGLSVFYLNRRKLI